MPLPPATIFTTGEICDLSIAVYEQFQYWLKRAEHAASESEKKFAEMKYTEQKALLTKLAGMLVIKALVSRCHSNLQNPN